MSASVLAVSPPVIVVCPECGASHVVPAHVARKAKRGLRTTRCAPCAASGRRGGDTSPLTPKEAAGYGRWWLERFTDDELADIAQALRVAGACAENIAASRARLRGQSRASTSRPSASPSAATAAAAVSLRPSVSSSA